MELNSKKLERTSNIVYWTISILLCFFLILLSNRIIDDLDTTTTAPVLEQFENKNILASIDLKTQEFNQSLNSYNATQSEISKAIDASEQAYNNEKQSFDNWLETRKTTGASDKDAEVVSRTKRLDDLLKVQQSWQEKKDAIDLKIEKLQATQDLVEAERTKEVARAEKIYETHLQSHDLKVFGIRLLFVAPILALGIFFFVRFRKHKFWPLFMGFSLFSLYAFFFGLVPYLPSYGGYVRYTVGVLMSIGLGYYAIKNIRTFIDKKQEELKSSSTDRAKNVQSEVAEKSFENHFCPSCGKDFMLRKWEMPLIANTENQLYKYVTNFCRHCGLALFVDCKQCGQKNYAHLRHCSACGCASENQTSPSQA